MRFRLTRRSFLAVGGMGVAGVVLGGYALSHVGGDDLAAAAPRGQAVPAGPPAPRATTGGTPVPEYEPAIVQAHEETRKARDIMRAKGMDFPLLVPTLAVGIEFSGVAPNVDNPGYARVEMAFGGIHVGKSDAKNAAITLFQLKSDRGVNFAPVPNLQRKKAVIVLGSTATLEIGGPYEFVPQGSMAITWESGGVKYRIQSSGISEEQILSFANSLISLT